MSRFIVLFVALVCALFPVVASAQATTPAPVPQGRIVLSVPDAAFITAYGQELVHQQMYVYRFYKDANVNVARLTPQSPEYQRANNEWARFSLGYQNFKEMLAAVPLPSDVDMQLHADATHINLALINLILDRRQKDLQSFMQLLQTEVQQRASQARAGEKGD